MAKRSKKRLIPQEVRDKVLLDSKRRCALCFAESNTVEVKEGALAHISPYTGKAENEKEDNLVFLCVNHHAMADHGDVGANELRSAKEKLYKALKQTANETFTGGWSSALSYEQLVCDLLKKALIDSFGPKIKVEDSFDTFSKSITERITLSAEVSFQGVTLRILADAKYSERPVEAETMRGFIGLLASVRPNKGIFVTNTGFTKSAEEIAKDFNISLFVLKENATEWNPVASI